MWDQSAFNDLARKGFIPGTPPKNLFKVRQAAAWHPGTFVGCGLYEKCRTTLPDECVWGGWMPGTGVVDAWLPMHAGGR